MNDLELLRLIRERRAELERMEFQRLGITLTDDLRGKALVALIEKAARRGDPDALERVQQCGKILGPEFQAAFVEYAARQEEEPPKNASDQEEFGEPGPEGEPAIAHVKPDAQGFARPAPVVQPPRPQPEPWHDRRSEPPGLRRSNELKRFFASRKPDNSPDRGSGWLKR